MLPFSNNMRHWERVDLGPNHIPPDPPYLPNLHTSLGQPQVRPPLLCSPQYVPMNPQVAGATLLHLNRQSAHLQPKRSRGTPTNGHVVHQGQAPLERVSPNTQQRPAPSASGGCCTSNKHIMSHVKDAADQFRELSQWLHQQINTLRDQGDENRTTLLKGQDNIKNVLTHVKDAADQFSKPLQRLLEQINALRDQGDENHTTLLEGQDNIKSVLYQIRNSQCQIQDEQRILESKLDDHANEISQLRMSYEKEQIRSKSNPGTNVRSLKRERTNQKPSPKRVRRSNQQGSIGGANGGTYRRRSSRIAHANEGIAKT